MSKTFRPKVSIVIPVYNGSNYLKEAIDSALAQTYKNIEIIVINDGSNDHGKTDKICKSYGKKIRYFVKENGGVASALNMGIDKMEGKYFSWLSHDDVYYSEKVEKQINLLSTLEDKETVIFSNYEIIDQNGQHISEKRLSQIYKTDNLNIPLYPFFHLSLNGCTMLIHRNHFKQFGNFDENLPTVQDYDLWFRILRNSSIRYVDEFLIKSRSHPQQGSKIDINTHIEECNSFWIKIFSNISLNEMINLEGSELNFYLNLYKSFKELTLYDKVISFLEKKMLEVFLSKYKEGEIGLGILEDIVRDEIVEVITEYPKKGKKHRIVFFTGNWYDRGGLNRIISVVASMLAKDFDIIVCCVKDTRNLEGYKLKKNIGFIEIEETDFTSLPAILKLLDVDVFIGSNNCFVPLIKLYENIENLGIKVIMWNHENYFLPYYDNKLKKILEVRTEVYNKVSVVLWLSRVSALVCRTFTNNVIVMGNPVSVSSTIKDLNKRGRTDLIAIGRFNSEVKRIDRLIKVFAKVLEINNNVKLYILGQYDLSLKFGEETVEELINRLSIPRDSIIFTGEVKNIEKYYSKRFINIMTSEREGFGLTVLEAASFGVPSVIFSSSGVKEIITNGINGFVVSEGDTVSMANKVLNLIEDRRLYDEVGKNAYKLSTKFKPEVISKKWKNLIRSLLGENEISLAEFCERDFLRYKDNYDSLLAEVVSFYEDAMKEQNVAILDQVHSSLSWRITYPIRKMEKLKELVIKQGFTRTIYNIFLKIIKRR